MQFSPNPLVYAKFSKLICERLLVDQDLLVFNTCFEEEGSIFINQPKDSIKLNDDASV